MSVIKAMVILKPRLLGKILDDFWSRFLLMFNIGFSVSVQLGQYFHGVTENTFIYNVMIGKMKSPLGNRPFLLIFNAVIIVITFASCAIIAIKKMIIHYKT